MPKNKEQTETQTPSEGVPEFDISKHSQILTEQEIAESFGGAHKITLPPFVKPDSIPVGSVIIGRIDSIIGDFTGREGMEDCQNLILSLPSGDKCTLPLTGTLQQSMLRVPTPHVGKMIAIKRMPNQLDNHFKRPMFMFDIYVLGVPQGQITMGDGEVKRRARKNR